MPRPSNTDSAETRARILDAALKRFGRFGVHVTSIREIAKDAGVTLATVHHHFGAKEELLLRCLEEAFEQQLKDGAQLIDAYVSAEPALRMEAVVKAVLRLTRLAPDRSRFLLRMYVFEENAKVRARLDQAQASFVSQLVELAPWDEATSVQYRRLAVVGLGMLLTRLAIGAPAERALLGGDDDEAWETIEAYVLDVARATLRISPV